MRTRTPLISALAVAGGLALLAGPALVAGPALGQAAPAAPQGVLAPAQSADRDYDAEITAAVLKAKTAAGFEHLGVLNRLCVLPPSAGAPSTEDTVPSYVSDPSTAPDRSTWFADPARVFDDLYFVGGSQHSAWALKTSDGIILIDTIYPYNSDELILDGMRRVGLEPNDIKYIVISHAHADHIGGVEIVQRATNRPPAVMGAADWAQVNAFPKRFTSMTPVKGKGKRIQVDGPRDLTLGDTTLKIIPTPGHTPGTLSYLFTVHDFGRPLTVAYSGGTAFNFQTDLPDPGIANLQTYIDSQVRLQQAADAAGATVVLSNHAEFDDAVDKTRMLAGRGYGPHPFENGATSVHDYFDVMIGCARAKQIGLERDAAEGGTATTVAATDPESLPEG